MKVIKLEDHKNELWHKLGHIRGAQSAAFHALQKLKPYEDLPGVADLREHLRYAYKQLDAERPWIPCRCGEREMP